jgi:hypothetical protein
LNFRLTAAVQLPAPVSVIVLPAMLQSPLTVKVTARPEVAVAATVNGGSPMTLSGSGLT